ncbi:MAG: peptidylprolyl isomerase [Patescibacteria group bacterium]
MQKSNLVIILVVIVVGLIGMFFYTASRERNRTDLYSTKSDIVLPKDEATPTLTISQNEEMPKTKNITKPDMQIDVNKNYTATLSTSEGDIVIELHGKETPITVNNFVYLAKQGFYDGTIFHRVIKDFMIQGGDPQGTGMGGPGYEFDDEPFQGEYVPGTVAMANAGPDTNGSQFFIMHGEAALPPNYVIFGNVQTGQAVVDSIATSATKVNPASGEKSVPVKPVVVKKVTISEN